MSRKAIANNQDAGAIVEIDIGQIEKAADPKVVAFKALFHKIGEECEKMDNAFSSLREIVDTLRGAKLYLKDSASIMTVTYYISEKHPEAKPDAIDRYVSNLKHLLRCPPEKIPANPSITVSRPAWQTVGDQVDVPFGDQLWHGVVLSDGSRESVHVYWVGVPPTGATRRQANQRLGNPVKLLRESLIWHQPGAMEGPSSLHSVEWIKDNYIRKEYAKKSVVVISSGDDTSSSSESSDIDESSQGVPSRKQDTPSELQAKNKGDSQDKGRGKGTQDKGRGKGKQAKGKGKGMNQADKRGRGDSVISTKPVNEEIHLVKRRPQEPHTFDWFSPCFTCDKMIGDLMLLQSRPEYNLDMNFFNCYLKLLELFRRGQGNFYKAADKFQSYYNTQAEALTQYRTVAVEFDATKLGVFIESMNKDLCANYEDAFTRNELVLISCLLAYPGLNFTNIRQKTTITQSDSATRGMAFVPQEVEAFIQGRLRLLRVLNDTDHPKHMVPLSTVVLSSTYCYHQLSSWGYEREWTSLSDEAFKLENFSPCLAINGIYVRIENQRYPHENRVYAQVMHLRTINALGIAHDDSGFKFSGDCARVIVLEPRKKQKAGGSAWAAKVYCFVSIGRCQADDPICVAKFSMHKWTTKAKVVEGVEMFSRLDDVGRPVYQAIAVNGASVQGCGSSPEGVSLEYGSDLALCREEKRANFRPMGLYAQAEHVDGNYHHAKGQWVKQAGRYYLRPHTPWIKDSDMEDANLVEPLYLDGTPAQNSISFVMGINCTTTLTFPEDMQGSREPPAGRPTPFGGFSGFSLVLKKHMGSSYLLNPNERPHVYGHCHDLRQFPAATMGQLIAILAASERIQKIRALRGNTSSMSTPRT
jgi:hypothetical protein